MAKVVKDAKIEITGFSEKNSYLVVRLMFSDGKEESFYMENKDDVHKLKTIMCLAKVRFIELLKGKEIEELK